MMRTSPVKGSVLLIAAFAVVASACGSSSSSTPAGGLTSPAGNTVCSSVDKSGTDLLAKICASGVLRVSTDPAYPPQSSYDQATGTWQGFDIDVADAIAKRLGVTVQWKTPAWGVITAGSWDGRWDVSVGSMTITKERAQVLDFTTPYYYTPAGLAVQKGSSITSFAQLAGKTVGSCGACTYEYYLERKLNIPGYSFQYVVPANVTIKTYNTDSTAIQDLVLGRLDAAMSAEPTLQEAVNKGKPIQLLGGPVFYEPLAVAIDKSAPEDPAGLTSRLDDVINDLHTDGTLTSLSMKWYHQDLTVSQPQAA